VRPRLAKGLDLSERIGNLTLATPQPIHVHAGAQCPTAGLVRVQRDDGASGQIQFNADGSVVVHYGDGAERNCPELPWRLAQQVSVMSD
jgi:hypothetical protein